MADWGKIKNPPKPDKSRQNGARHRFNSQTQEFEADNIAMALMAAAGYNPTGLTDMLRMLGTIQTAGSSGFGRTHPTPQQRITNAERTVRTHNVADTASYRQDRFAVAAR